MDSSEHHMNQASGLRRISGAKPVRVVAVASGKGGVGKTNVSVNLAISLAAMGREVMLLDADLGLANVDIMLGLQPGPDLSHVIDGQCSLEDIIVTGPAGVKVVPASSGLQRMTALTAAEHAGLIGAFSELGLSPDVLVIDTAAGISDSVVSFTLASQEVMVVICDEPASITDAYALIKLLHRDYGRDHFRIVANMVRSTTAGKELFLKLVRVSDRFLSVSLTLAGIIPFDEYLRTAVRKQLAVVQAYPASRVAKAFKDLAGTADTWSMPSEAGGHLEFFFERLIRASQRAAEVRT